MGFFYGIFSYGSSGGSTVGVLYGFFGEVGLRYRLLWFWVFRCVIPRVLPMGLGWVEGCGIGCYGRGARVGCMVRQ